MPLVRRLAESQQQAQAPRLLLARSGEPVQAMALQQQPELSESQQSLAWPLRESQLALRQQMLLRSQVQPELQLMQQVQPELQMVQQVLAVAVPGSAHSLPVAP